MDLITWSWIFLVVYIGGMLTIGVIGQRRVKHADDFATARGSYGPIPLAFAFAATTASGATFLGNPGLSYQFGLAAQWGNFLYPVGVYFGVLITMRLIATSGNRLGNRSIPEFLGDRYQSDGIRVMVAIFSLMLFFYLAGQLVSGLVMFETMLGLTPFWALTITTVVLLVYVTLGGAHADILTDAVQGVMMLIIAVVVILLFIFGAGLGGLLARAMFADALFAEGATPNQALPLLFIELFPTWLAALVGVGVLAAIMSTADGLVVSSSQIIANDLYRRTIAPRLAKQPTEDELDRQVLFISRVATFFVLLACMGMAWALIDTNIALIVWIGNGGMMAAFAGPLVMGVLWRGVTRYGAYAGLASGFFTLLILHMQLLDPAWFGSGALHGIVTWLHGEGPNPFSCAAMGEGVSIVATFTVSKLTQPLPKDHIEEMFGNSAST